MGKLFGTDGIRGVVNAGLDADLAYKVGLAAAQVLAKDKQPGEKPLVTIGKDTRISGDLLKGSLIAGLCTAGADVLDLGTLPTPGVAWVTVASGATEAVPAIFSPLVALKVKDVMPALWKVTPKPPHTAENLSVLSPDLATSGQQVSAANEPSCAVCVSGTVTVNAVPLNAEAVVAG